MYFTVNAVCIDITGCPCCKKGEMFAAFRQRTWLCCPMFLVLHKWDLNFGLSDFIFNHVSCHIYLSVYLSIYLSIHHTHTVNVSFAKYTGQVRRVTILRYKLLAVITEVTSHFYKQKKNEMFWFVELNWLYVSLLKSNLSILNYCVQCNTWHTRRSTVQIAVKCTDLLQVNLLYKY